MRIAGEKRYPRNHCRHDYLTCPVFTIAQVGRHVSELPCLKSQLIRMMDPEELD